MSYRYTMAGPAASVLVSFDRYTPTWRELMDAFASAWHSSNSCLVSDTHRYGGTYSGEPRPFVGSVEPMESDCEEWPEDAAMSEAIRRFAGRQFTNSIVVAAMCNHPDDHYVLCDIVTGLADRLDGLIDFDCLDVPEASGLQRCAWRFDGQEYWTTLGTSAQARYWLRHPEFHMLK